MKVFFWDFNEDYDLVKTSNYPTKKIRDFFDYFYKKKIDVLIRERFDILNGIVTNGNLDSQISLLKKYDLDFLFEEDLLYSSSLEAKKLVKSFPPYMINFYIHPSSIFNSKINYRNLFSLISKPNSYLYETASTEFQISPKDCYVLGTDYKDFFAAKKAGMNSIHIRGWENFGNFNIRNFKDKPDYIINKRDMFKGLKNILDNIEKDYF